MHREPSKFSRVQARCFRWLLPWAVVLAGVSPGRAQIDTAVDLSVWKMLYGVTDAQASDPAWLARDDDGDGLSNGAELAAGTDPFNAASGLAVTSTTSEWRQRLPRVRHGQPGKLYSVQSTATARRSRELDAPWSSVGADHWRRHHENAHRGPVGHQHDVLTG